MTPVNAARGTQRGSVLRQMLSRVRSPQDFAAGLFLIAIGAFALWQTRDLPIGSLRVLGPGWVPHLLAVLLAVCGVVLLVVALRHDGQHLERWGLRGPIFVFGATLLFALTIRSLGLLVAGPLLIIVGGMGSSETHWRETAIFGVAMTAFCIALFRWMLSLPIPIAPWLIGY